MNKVIKTFVVIFIVAFAFLSNSCEDFKTFPLNIPFQVPVVAQGSTSPVTASSTYCLNQSDTYQKYVEDIKELTFVQAAWRTDSVKNITKGDVTITIEVVGGATLFQKTLTDINPTTYQSPNASFILTLTQPEIDALNNYFNTYLQNPNQCLRATVSANVDTGTPPYYLRGIVDIVVEAEIETGA